MSSIAVACEVMPARSVDTQSTKQARQLARKSCVSSSSRSAGLELGPRTETAANTSQQQRVLAKAEDSEQCRDSKFTGHEVSKDMQRHV
jgi:hypothetical protein